MPSPSRDNFLFAFLALSPAGADEGHGRWMKSNDPGWIALTSTNITFRNGEDSPCRCSPKPLIITF
jgi:hypothetical protein